MSQASFTPSHHSSPWSSNSSKDSPTTREHPTTPSAQTDTVNNISEIDHMPSENRGIHSAYPGSTPLPMPVNSHQGRGSFSPDTRDEGRNSSTGPGASGTGWNPAPVNAPYGVIGSNINAPSVQPRRTTESIQALGQKAAALASSVSSRSISLGRDQISQIPPAPLSAPPFKTSFFPLFGPPRTRQGFIMPGDWTINSNGFLISENARRMNALAVEADKAEYQRRASSERPGGPAAGCRMCAAFPRVMLFPCEHRVCSECGSRFMTASGGMYCSCGELVSSMLNLNVPHALDLYPGYYVPVVPQPTFSPQTISAQRVPTREIQPVVSPPSAPTRTPVIVGDPQLVKTPTAATAPQLNLHFQTDHAPKQAHKIAALSMDAETAIEDAPFIELGRHALAQNWCCVKISNIPYSVTAENILEFLGKNAKIVPDDIGLSVHIIMDRASGKTMDAFVEFTCPKDAYRCVIRKRGKILGARHVLLDVVNQEELMKEIFPRARGVAWEGVIPKVLNGENGNTKADIVTKEELVLVVGHARTPHRSPFSRKCLQRPYESILSIVAKFPWFAVNVYTIHQRDIIYQALLSTIDILKRQCKRGRTTPNLDTELLKKLCKAGVFCSGFTNKQKREIIKVGEFGAEGLATEVGEDIKGFEGLLSLSKKRGAEGKVVEFFGMLSSLHSRQQQAAHFHSLEITDPEKQAAISRLPSALIDELDGPEHPENTTPANCIFGLGSQDALSEKEIETRSKYTMAEMADYEWNAIERVVREVLPSRCRAREVLGSRSNNV
ncbi:hypothetical protein DFH27DRAFT_170935 [Peziza echinospora]|nr:hypothetical protein DFH27DRAFT_170935 [Peziza echinospora]